MGKARAKSTGFFYAENPNSKNKDCLSNRSRYAAPESAISLQKLTNNNYEKFNQSQKKHTQ